MADKVDKPKKKAKAKQDEKGVLAALPSTRPERIGSRRSAASAPAPTTAASTRAATTSASAKPAAKTSAKPAAKAKAKPAAKRARPAGKRAAKRRPRATAARRKAAAPRTFEPTQAAEAAAGAADERAAGALPRDETRSEERTYPRPRPVSDGAPGIGRTGYRDEEPDRSGRPGGVELAATAVRAAGEVAQLGLTIGGQVLKRVVDRLPKP
jgi:hypothetical protein